MACLGISSDCKDRKVFWFVTKLWKKYSGRESRTAVSLDFKKIQEARNHEYVAHVGAKVPDDDLPALGGGCLAEGEEEAPMQK